MDGARVLRSVSESPSASERGGLLVHDANCHDHWMGDFLPCQHLAHQKRLEREDAEVNPEQNPSWCSTGRCLILYPEAWCGLSGGQKQKLTPHLGHLPYTVGYTASSMNDPL